MTPEELAAKQRMLRLWNTLSDTRRGPTPVTIVTTDATVVRAASLVANGSQSLFATTQLQTPLGTYPSAVLRASDVVEINATLSHRQLRELAEEDEESQA